MEADEAVVTEEAPFVIPPDSLGRLPDDIDAATAFKHVTINTDAIAKAPLDAAKAAAAATVVNRGAAEIGRASCRERVFGRV